MAITLKQPRPMTDQDLLELSRLNPGYQFERDAKGELIVTPTGSEAGRRSARLTQQLTNWADQHGGGFIFDASTGFGLPDGSILAPDASWIRRDRWEALSVEQREGFAPLCPDAVFEVRSKSNTLRELREKMRAYLANGAHLGVLIDPDSRTVEVYRSRQEPVVLADPATVALDPELPGFALELAPIFD